MTCQAKKDSTILESFLTLKSVEVWLILNVSYSSILYDYLFQFFIRKTFFSDTQFFFVRCIRSAPQFFAEYICSVPTSKVHLASDKLITSDAPICTCLWYVYVICDMWYVHVICDMLYVSRFSGGSQFYYEPPSVLFHRMSSWCLLFASTNNFCWILCKTYMTHEDLYDKCFHRVQVIIRLVDCRSKR